MLTFYEAGDERDGLCYPYAAAKIRWVANLSASAAKTLWKTLDLMSGRINIERRMKYICNELKQTCNAEPLFPRRITTMLKKGKQLQHKGNK